MAENTRTQDLLLRIETLTQEEFDELIGLVEGQPLDLEYDLALMKRREELQQQNQSTEGYPLGYELSEADFTVSDDEIVSTEEIELEPVVEEVITPEKSPQEKAQEILETLRANPNAQIEGVDLATASTLNNMANGLGYEDLYIMEAIDNVVKDTYNNLSEDEKADLEPEVREAMESRVNARLGTMQNVEVSEREPENTENENVTEMPETENVVEEPEPEPEPIPAENSEEKPQLDKESLFQSFDKFNYEQLQKTLIAAKTANDTEQVALIEEYVEKMAKDVNDGKKLILDIQDKYEWQALLGATGSVKPAILTALINVDKDIENFAEEFGFDHIYIQSDEQIATNYHNLTRLENTDFFARIDKPHTPTWTSKDFADWRKNTFAPSVLEYAGALRSPEYANLSQEEKNKLLDGARSKLNDSEELNHYLNVNPSFYGDLKLIVDELKKTNPDNVAVKNTDEKLARFVENRGGSLLLYPQMEDANKALGQINVKGDLQLFGRKSVEQDGKDSEIAKLKELARIETETYLAHTTPVGEAIDENRFATEYAARLNKNILALIQADGTAKGAKQDEISKTLDSFNAGKPVDISQSTFTGYYAAQVMRHMAANDMMAKSRPSLIDYLDKARAKIVDFDKKCTERYGSKYTVTKNVLKSLAWGAAFGAASAAGPAAMAAVATVSFANSAWGICKDFKAQKAKLLAQTEGKRRLTFREYAKNNKLRIAGACLSASTVAISGLGAVGVAVGPSIMQAKSLTGIGLALAGASKQAALARQQVIEQNKHLPKDKQKSVFWAGLKAYAISATSFGAGMLGGQMGAQTFVGAGAGAVMVDNVASADNLNSTIDTQTPTNENTAPTQVMDTINREQILDTLNREQVLDSLNKENVNHQDTIAVRDSLLNENISDIMPEVKDTTNVTDTTSVADSLKADDATLKDIQDLEDKILNNGEQQQDAQQTTQEEVKQSNSGTSNSQTTSKEFWDNRVDKFLGEDIKNSLYSRIDSGEIKLPEGIGSKEEFAYKLAMAMEQSPAYVADALGVEFQTTAQFESQIQSMTQEQFAKLGDLMNDYSDRGNYIGDKPLETTLQNVDATETTLANNSPSELSDNATLDGVKNDETVLEQNSQPIENNQLNDMLQDIEATIDMDPVVDHNPVRADGFYVTLSETGDVNFRGASLETFEESAQNLVGRDSVAIKDLSNVMLQNAIIQDLETQIADGATFNAEQLQALSDLKSVYEQNLDTITQKYNLSDNLDMDKMVNDAIAANYEQSLRVPEIEIDQIVDATSGYQQIQSNISNITNEFNERLDIVVKAEQGEHTVHEDATGRTDTYKIGDDLWHITRNNGENDGVSAIIEHTNDRNTTETVWLYSNGEKVSSVANPENNMATYEIKDIQGNVVETKSYTLDTPNPVVVNEDGTISLQQAVSSRESQSSEIQNSDDKVSVVSNGNSVEHQDIDLDNFKVDQTYHMSDGLGSNVISIKDSNGELIFNETVEIKPNNALASNLLPEDKQSYMIAKHGVYRLISENALYDEISSKENPTVGEQAFMKHYEGELDKYGITRADDGSLVRTDTLDIKHKAENGVVYECTKNGVEIVKDGRLSEIEAKDKAYQDIISRRVSYDRDERPNMLELKFLKEHEQELRDKNMWHDNRGNLVQLPEDVSVTKDGAAYRIQANIVSERSAYGLNQQDYFADAKELLGNSSKAADRIEVKSFLINDDIYSDLKARQEAGETFSSSEQAAISRFMANHEKAEAILSEKYGLARGDDGEIHKASTQSNTSVKVSTKAMPIRQGGRG